MPYKWFWSDILNGDAYQEIKVKDGGFDAEVILDTNQVYELCVPHPEYGFAAYTLMNVTAFTWRGMKS